MSIRFYPVAKPAEGGYSVKVNGRIVPTDTARVSAMPYNRRWPGHQRSLDQTEVIQFLSMEADEPLNFEITLPEPAKKAVLRPYSLGVAPEISPGGKVRFSLPRPAYFTLEPYGRRNALHFFVDAPETNIPDKTAENVIYFGSGEHDVGNIELKSGETLYLDAGAVVYACVTATDAEKISILGRGILDNSRNKEQILFEANEEDNKAAVNNAVRRHTIQLEYCSDVLIDGITIRDSLVYNIRPIGCRRLWIRGVKIIGCWRYNSDGIDMHNCEDVFIENCFLRTFDDAICIKGFDCYYEGDVEKAVREAMYRGGESYDVFRNVLVKNCVIWNDWGKALEIGAETRAEEISYILFDDCDIIHVCGPVLDCCNVDYADVHDVVYRNIRVELDETIPPPRLQKRDDEPYGDITPGYQPPLICGVVEYHFEYSAGGERRGINRGLLFENIAVTGGLKPWASFSGYSEEFCCRDIKIRNITVDGKPLSAGEFGMNIGEHCRNIVFEG
jgi:hypothetical protein